MQVYIAKHSGFCFGVRRAVELAERAAVSGPLYSFGKLIHNEQVVEELQKKGVTPIESTARLQAGDRLLIRAHGAPPKVYSDCQQKGVIVLDATCPFVARIHRIVREEAAAGKRVFVAGQAEHPEVIGILGHAGADARVLESPLDASETPYTDKAVLVAQTTLNKERFTAIATALATRVGELSVQCTICDTTEKRQWEAEQLAKRSTKVFVLGSKTSANTKALADLCKMYCKQTKMIENIGKITLDILESNDIISYVAGASTPDAIIREVIQVMSELENTTIETIEAEAPAEVVAETTEAVEAPAAEAVAEPEAEAPVAEEAVTEPEAPAAEEAVTESEAPAAEEAAAEAESTVAEEAAAEPAAVEAAPEAEAEDEASDDFSKAFEKTVKRIHTGQVITGTVLQIVDGEVFVNVGYKSDGMIPKGEFSSDPEVKVEDVIKEGDSIDVEVVKVNDGEGNVLLSRKNVEGKKLWDELLAGDVEGKVLDAVGKEVVKGGLIAEVKGGVRAFIPASHVSTKYVENLNEFVGKEMKVKVLEADKQRKRIVASAKQVLLDEAEKRMMEKWDSLVVGSKVHGVVRRITDFGAFVDIGGLDGLVHVTDAAWGRVKHPSDALSIGQEIDVLILGVDKEKKRISLGYKQLQPKPWTKAAEKYPIGTIVEGKVVRIVPFGAFVALEPTIDGLIHISQVATRRIEKVEDELKVGDIVRCKVLEVNVEAKRISLSRKDAILEENPEIAAQLAAEKAERERLYQERKAQREADRERIGTERKERSNTNTERRPSDGTAAAPAERRDTRPDRRRRNNEDGDYELPPVTSTTTSLKDLFANFKPEE